MSGKNKTSRRQRAIQRGIKQALNSPENSGIKQKSIDFGGEWMITNPRDRSHAAYFAPYLNLLYNSEFLYTIAQTNTTVSASIAKIASTFASFRIKLYQRDNDNILRPVRGVKHTEHPLKSPNFEDSEHTLKLRMATSLMIEGGFYLVYSGGLYVVPPKEMRYDSNKDVYYMFGGKTPLNKEQVRKVGFPHSSLEYNSKYFNSPLRTCLSETLLNTNVVMHASNQLKNGAMIKGILQSTNSFTTQSQLDSIAESFNSKASGLDSSSIPALPEGYTFIPLQMTAAESGLISLYDISKSAIIQNFQLPEGLLKNEYTAYNSAQAQKQFFSQATIGPMLDMTEDVLNNWSMLTGDREYYIFDRTDIISPEEKKQKALALDAAMSAAVKAKSLGTFSANEIRAMCSYDKIIDLDGNLVEEADENPFILNGIETLLNPDPITTQPDGNGNQDNNNNDNNNNDNTNNNQGG